MSEFQFQTATYAGTGQQAIMKLNQGKDCISKGQVVAGPSDVWTLQVQMCAVADLISHPDYTNQTGSRPFRVNQKCYALALDITTNTSGAIKLQNNPE